MIGETIHDRRKVGLVSVVRTVRRGKTVVAAGLKTHFYGYLIKRSGAAQFIVMENQDPPYGNRCFAPTLPVVA
ncbi:hypothetical protein IE4803_CH02589 [Rhizobium etli bv. phaseoli str. IE4803]|nr:hypothetical protein IE4803_CH02589 [Rhizobium etli bv. phaseoli str. IE4803]